MAHPPSAAPGWYPDPEGSGSHRYWDGSRWTDAVSSAIPPGPPSTTETATTWAAAGHLSALLSLFFGLPFLGPLVVYIVKRDDPLVRPHAAEALNWNLSVTVYGAVLALLTVLLLLVLIGVLLIPVLLVLAAVWVVLVVVASVRASRGEAFRYPLTMRFVR
jgi:uncharacterized protein